MEDGITIQSLTRTDSVFLTKEILGLYSVTSVPLISQNVSDVIC